MLEDQDLICMLGANQKQHNMKHAQILKNQNKKENLFHGHLDIHQMQCQVAYLFAFSFKRLLVLENYGGQHFAHFSYLGQFMLHVQELGIIDITQMIF